ncbi:unnamed protein product [Paramecium octaurelia]|uniref:Uncharacterized protein n=1 Tax=Paramecium octaurelia TaxID=43137 RepID=A0A8S1W1A4_PAROT|nr:unnamed protein product [Paramecium octaurelia]
MLYYISSKLIEDYQNLYIKFIKSQIIYIIIATRKFILIINNFIPIFRRISLTIGRSADYNRFV